MADPISSPGGSVHARESVRSGHVKVTTISEAHAWSIRKLLRLDIAEQFVQQGRRSVPCASPLRAAAQQVRKLSALGVRSARKESQPFSPDDDALRTTAVPGMVRPTAGGGSERDGCT